MLRSTSSSLFRSLRNGRSSSPPPLQYGQNVYTKRSILQNSTSSIRFPLITALVVGLLFLISLFSKPDSTINYKFQMPGLLPSKPYQNIHIEDPKLMAKINSTCLEFQKYCPSNGNLPVYLNPSLTQKQKIRYSILKKTDVGEKDKFMLVTNTRQIENHLPDLLNTLIILINFLGSEKILISILEGPSNDCTSLVINKVLIPLLNSLGLKKEDENPQYKITTDEPKINWSNYNRIEKISELRNKALTPLWDKTTEWSKSIRSIVFFNDVFLKASDILELLYQHEMNNASITTGMDWWKKKPEYYYDIWVGRTIDTGDLFYPIDWTWWSPSSNLFSNSPLSKKKYQALEPFQVYSSWNALAILSPEPFLPPYDVRFRRSDKSKNECAASECTLIASDFWKEGFGKVLVVPSVQLAYERDVAIDIVEELFKQKEQLGWIDAVPPIELDTKVDWIDKPPEKVRCHPWPEVNGLSANVWEQTLWVDPWLLNQA